MNSRRPAVAVALLMAACAEAAPSRDEPSRRDSLVASAPPSPMPVAPAVPVTVRDDSTSQRLRVFIGFTPASGNASLPQLAIVAGDGRRTGWNPVTRGTDSQIARARYESSSTAADDDREPGKEPLAGPVIDLREIDVVSHAGESYTLEVAAEAPGTFVLDVALFGERGGRAAHQEINDLALGRGEVRRFLIGIEAGAMTVHAAPVAVAR